MFKTYTGWQWLLIDAANHFGLDKLTFEARIQWTETHLKVLEDSLNQAENKPLYMKAVMAIRDAQAGKAIGHRVGVDACCSGIQVLSVLTGCIAGATATGLVDPDRRADAYAQATQVMQDLLGMAFHVERSDAKAALMTSFYGSRKTPKEIFGENTPELNAFYQAANIVAPGAWELLQDLLAAWQPYALSHQWKLPDGFDARVKVMQKNELRIEVDELDHATFTYEYYENAGSKTGISLPANVTHSVDAYILRSMHRRCNYDRELVEQVNSWINQELHHRLVNPCRGVTLPWEATGSKLEYYVQQWNRTGIVDVVILPYLTQKVIGQASTQYLERLSVILAGMLQYQPFELVTIHDEFTAHANNINWVRWQYKEILADIADSNLVSDLLSQIHGKPGNFPKLSTNLGDLIRQSNYALT